jgi:CheY-like chemotaxis protein
MSSKPLLMIIDDNQDFQDQYSMLAEMAGYDVESILDGQAAMERLEKDPIPTLILLDSIMPNISGDEVLTALRANEKWAPVPVYILTADVRFAPGLYNRLPDAPQADGILEKGANAIVQVRAILARYKKDR